MVFWGGASVPLVQTLARGEYWLSPAVASTNVASSIVEGAPLKMLEMKEGATTVMQSMGVLKNTSHPNAAKLFVNWILTKEGQTNLVKPCGGVSSLRKDMPELSCPGLMGRPHKPLPRTWEVTQAENTMHKEGVAEQLFGKK